MKKETKEKLKTYTRKQQTNCFGHCNETIKIDLNKNLQHSQNAINLDTYNRMNLENGGTHQIMNVPIISGTSVRKNCLQ